MRDRGVEPIPSRRLWLSRPQLGSQNTRAVSDPSPEITAKRMLFYFNQASMDLPFTRKTGQRKYCSSREVNASYRRQQRREQHQANAEFDCVYIDCVVASHDMIGLLQRNSRRAILE